MVDFEKLDDKPHKDSWEVLKNNGRPRPDMCSCSKCGWDGKCSECETDMDGNWESGYFELHLCPVCEDGGLIEDYFYSSDMKEGSRCPSCGVGVLGMDEIDGCLCDETTKMTCDCTVPFLSCNNCGIRVDIID